MEQSAEISREIILWNIIAIFRSPCQDVELTGREMIVSWGDTHRQSLPDHCISTAKAGKQLKLNRISAKEKQIVKCCIW